MYYEKVEDIQILQAKNKIKHVLEEALEKQTISKEEFNAMEPDEKNPSKLYCNFKIHKPHTEKENPPPRPIISGSGSITENISVYVEHHIKELSTQHQTYLQDTPHLLRIIHKLNKGPKLLENAIIVTADLIGAYQNIPQGDGIECLKEALEERPQKEIPSEFIAILMELIQTCNLFEFNGDLWKQLVGVAMGIHPAPSYANIYLARRIDEKIKELGIKYGKAGKSSFLLLKRFLDDILKIFSGTTKELHKLFNELNLIHPTLRFTMQHTTPKTEKKSWVFP